MALYEIVSAYLPMNEIVICISCPGEADPSCQVPLRNPDGLGCSTQTSRQEAPLALLAFQLLSPEYTISAPNGSFPSWASSIVRFRSMAIPWERWWKRITSLRI